MTSKHMQFCVLHVPVWMMLSLQGYSWLLTVFDRVEGGGGGGILRGKPNGQKAKGEATTHPRVMLNSSKLKELCLLSMCPS